MYVYICKMNYVSHIVSASSLFAFGSCDLHQYLQNGSTIVFCNYTMFANFNVFICPLRHTSAPLFLHPMHYTLKFELGISFQYWRISIKNMFYRYIWRVASLWTPISVCWLVGLSVGPLGDMSVFHFFLKVTFQCYSLYIHSFHRTPRCLISVL